MGHTSSHKKSLLQQLFAAITSLTLTILALVTAAITIINTEHLDSELDREISQFKAQLENKGKILARQIRTPINQNLIHLNLTALQQDLNQLVAENDDLDFAILMSKARTAYAHTLRPEFQTRILNDEQSRQHAATTTSQTLEYAAQKGTYLETVTPISLGARHWGVLRLGFSMAATESMMIKSHELNKKVTYWIILASSLTALIFIILGWFIALHIAKRITTPLQKLTKQADDILSGNYHSLTETTKHISNDATIEIAQLGATLQKVSLNLKKS